MKLVAKLTFVMSLLFSATASAALSDVFDDIFSQHTTNYTGAGSGEAELLGMGYLSGGSLEMRRKVSTPKIITFDPPRAKVGCNGWSLFGGSLSYIKLDQFVEYAREILTNSAGYLFEIALKAICSTCAQTMDLLRQGADAVNNMMRDSCTTAKALMDNLGVKEIDASNSLINTGSINSNLETWITKLEEKTTSFYNLQQQAQVGSNPTAQKELEEMEGNLIFRALEKNELITKLFPELHLKNSVQHPEFRAVAEEIQSITGTIIKGIEAQRPSGAASGDAPVAEESTLQVTYHGEPNLDFETLFRGEQTTGEPTAIQPEMLVCADSIADDPYCKNLTSLPRAAGAVAGLLNKFEEIIVGNGVTVGILQKMTLPHNYAGFTAEEKAFMKTTPFAMQTMLQNVANKGTSGMIIGKNIARLVAVERFREFLDQLLNVVGASISAHGDLSSTNRQNFESLLQRIDFLKLQLAEWSTKNYEDLSAHVTLQDMYFNVMKGSSGDNVYRQGGSKGL